MIQKIRLWGVWLILAAVFGMTCNEAPSPGETVERYFQAFEKGDAATMMRLSANLPSDTTKFSVKTWKQQVLEPGMKLLQSKGGIKEIRITGEEVDEDGEDAMVKHTLVYHNGDTQSEIVVLVWKDNTWKISMIQKTD